MYFQPKFVEESSELLIRKDQFARIYKIDPLPPKNQNEDEQFGLGMWFWEHRVIFHGQCAINGKNHVMTVDELNQQFEGIAKFELNENHAHLKKTP